MAILVTGSAGFIGFHVVRFLLERGEEVVGIDNLSRYYDVQIKNDRNNILKKYSKYTFSKLNIVNKDGLEKIFFKKNIDKIVHLAAQAGVRYSLVNPHLYIDSNINGFLNILQCGVKFGIKKIVYASSSSVYGNTWNTGGFSEEKTFPSPISFYGITKFCDEQMAEYFYQLYQISVIGLRLFTVYGPWGRPDMAYFKFTKNIIKGVPIEVYNFGKMYRDFTYIDDAVYGIVSSLDSDYTNEIFNIGNNKSVSLLRFIDILEELLSLKAKVKYLPLQRGDMLKTYANIEKAKSCLNFSPTTDIKKGLKNFINWYVNYYKIKLE